MTPQVVGYRVNTIQGRLYAQAPNEVFGVVLVEVKGDLGHIFPGLVTGVEVKPCLNRKKCYPIKCKGSDGSRYMAVRLFSVNRPTDETHIVGQVAKSLILCHLDYCAPV